MGLENVYIRLNEPYAVLLVFQTFCEIKIEGHRSRFELNSFKAKKIRHFERSLLP